MGFVARYAGKRPMPSPLGFALQLDCELADAHRHAETLQGGEAAPYADWFAPGAHRTPSQADTALQAPSPLDAHCTQLTQRLVAHQDFQGFLLYCLRRQCSPHILMTPKRHIKADFAINVPVCGQ